MMGHHGYGGPGGFLPGYPSPWGAGGQQGQKGGRGQKNIQISDHLFEGGGRKNKGKGGGQVAAPVPEKVPATPAPMQATCAPGEESTVMLRNVPNGYSRAMLLELLDSQGFQGRYDFVYLPMDFRNEVNLGYAFVNSLEHQDAVELSETLQGFADWKSDSTKVCEVSWAHPHQGFQEHVERYRNSPVMHPSMPDEYKPMVFKNGIQQPFPAPTKAIKAPKLRPNPRELQ
jgi:hypothetical protein